MKINQEYNSGFSSSNSLSGLDVFFLGLAGVLRLRVGFFDAGFFAGFFADGAPLVTAGTFLTGGLLCLGCADGAVFLIGGF